MEEIIVREGNAAQAVLENMKTSILMVLLLAPSLRAAESERSAGQALEDIW